VRRKRSPLFRIQQRTPRPSVHVGRRREGDGVRQPRPTRNAVGRT
jgi:hypothetical protein